MKNIHKVGIIMNGVTGRMGLNQHLRRSIYAIMQQGGLACGGDGVIMPDPILVGRNANKLEQIAKECGGLKWSTDVDATIADPAYSIYFDAQTTDRRAGAVIKAIDAGKHVYCEKPTADKVEVALDLHRRAEAAGVKHGVVQDKLWLPGLLKLKTLQETGFFGKILSVRGEFGYWVFEGDSVLGQRPSWNYRKEDGGGIIIDMLCHWRYVLDKPLRRSEVGVVPWGDSRSPTLGRAGQAVRMHRGRLGIRNVSTGRGRDCALQFVMVGARAAR